MIQQIINLLLKHNLVDFKNLRQNFASDFFCIFTKIFEYKINKPRKNSVILIPNKNVGRYYGKQVC